MRNATGYGTWTDPKGEAALVERDSFRCCHCGDIKFVEPKQAASDAGGWCMRCAKPICGACADIPTCRPFERWLDQMEARDRLFRSVLG